MFYFFYKDWFAMHFHDQFVLITTVAMSQANSMHAVPLSWELSPGSGRYATRVPQKTWIKSKVWLRGSLADCLNLRVWLGWTASLLHLRLVWGSSRMFHLRGWVPPATKVMVVWRFPSHVSPLSVWVVTKPRAKFASLLLRLLNNLLVIVLWVRVPFEVSLISPQSPKIIRKRKITF
jgi:hypothetical protein